jgi:hypothetical protein
MMQLIMLRRLKNIMENQIIERRNKTKPETIKKRKKNYINLTSVSEIILKRTSYLKKAKVRG